MVTILTVTALIISQMTVVNGQMQTVMDMETIQKVMIRMLSLTTQNNGWILMEMVTETT